MWNQLTVAWNHLYTWTKTLKPPQSTCGVNYRPALKFNAGYSRYRSEQTLNACRYYIVHVFNYKTMLFRFILKTLLCAVHLNLYFIDFIGNGGENSVGNSILISNLGTRKLSLCFAKFVVRSFIVLFLLTIRNCSNRSFNHKNFISLWN